MWAASTQASNWILTELYARDARRTGKEEKLPPMPKIYLYPELRERFPELPSQAVASLENTVKAKYRAKRYETIWTAKSSLPVYRYPAIFRAEPRLVAHAEEGSAGRERAPWRETRGFAAEARHALPSPTRGVARRRSGHSRSGRTRPLSAAAMRAVQDGGMVTARSRSERESGHAFRRDDGGCHDRGAGPQGREAVELSWRADSALVRRAP
jgi:hypothetical protein